MVGSRFPTVDILIHRTNTGIIAAINPRLACQRDVGYCKSGSREVGSEVKL